MVGKAVSAMNSVQVPAGYSAVSSTRFRRLGVRCRNRGRKYGAVFEVIFQLMNAAGSLWGAHALRKSGCINRGDLGMLEARLGHKVTALRWSVGRAGKIETGMSQLLQHIGPLSRFEGNSICPRQASGDETDVTNITLEMIFVTTIPFFLPRWYNRRRSEGSASASQDCDADGQYRATRKSHHDYFSHPKPRAPKVGALYPRQTAIPNSKPPCAPICPPTSSPADRTQARRRSHRKGPPTCL